MDDSKAFIQETEAIRERLAAKEVSYEEIDAAVAVYRLMPIRMELLESTDHIWDRFEWSRENRWKEWDPPKRLLPY